MQGQLGVNKKKPLIELVTSDDDNILYVYLGFIYYATVPNDPKSVQYRLLVGQLAFAGFSIVQLMRVFDLSRPTIYRYRDIVANCTDEAELFIQLRGHHCDKTKLTPEIEAFIKTRFQKIYQKNRRNYNQQLRDEVYNQFGVKLSPEAVRQVIAPLRQELDRSAKAEPKGVSGNDVAQRTDQEDIPRVIANPAEIEEHASGPTVYAVYEEQTTSDQKVVAVGNANEPHEAREQFYLHAGLLVLNFWMVSFVAVFQSWGTYFLQWLYQIFAGAVNFEQSRYLPRNEISHFIGDSAVSVSKSRSLLKELAHDSFAECLQLFLQINLDFVTQHLKDRINYFYIDGHFDPYYGKIDILQGWACLFNRTMKGSHHYVIHDRRGYPFLKELKDCYDDFRDYIKHAIQRLKEIMPGMSLGIVFDRGAFSRKILRTFVEAGVHFLTWQKYFDIDKEPKLNFKSKVVIEREINEVGKFQPMTFGCAETTYRFGPNEEDQCRKLVIRTEQKDNKKSKASYFYAAILTTDPFASHQKIVETMTGRWRCQENDFRYEKNHFGLDQITSYDIMPVESLKDKIDGQKGQRQALQKELSEVQSERQKIYDELGFKRLTKNRVKRIEKEAKENPQAHQRVQKLRDLQPVIEELSTQNKQLERKIKRLEKIEEKGYVKLDYRKKQIFDHLRVTARNIFYTAIEEFKEHYTNLRDLHVVFWKLVRSSGIIQFEKEQIIVTLNCPFFEGKVLKAVTRFLQNLNDREPIFLDGTKRKIYFRVNSEIAN